MGIKMKTLSNSAAEMDLINRDSSSATEMDLSNRASSSAAEMDLINRTSSSAIEVSRSKHWLVPLRKGCI